MFNTHFNVDRSNTIKLSTTALIGLLSLTFNTAAQSHDSHLGHVIKEEKSVSSAMKGKRQKAQDNTNALKQAMADYRGASAKNKHRYLEQMISLANGRQELLSELSLSDPSAISKVALKAESRKGIPKEVLGLLEQERTLEGELEVFYEDYEDHSKSRLLHVLKTTEGFVKVNSASLSKFRSIHSGTKVRLRGWKITDSDESTDLLVLGEEQESLSLLAQDSSSTTTTASVAETSTVGEQSTLVMLLNFQDNIQQPWTTSETQDLVFGKVNDFYKENSDGQTWLKGEVVGYYTLPIDSTCDSWNIHVSAQQMAEESGVDVSSYTRLIYIFPKNDSCGWTGMGTLGGTQTRAYINGSFTMNTIGHEMGHNFGLHHAEYLNCKDNIIGDDCLAVTYGDNMDIMGAYGVEGHFNAFNKEQLGWLSTDLENIVEANTDGSYVIEPYETSLLGSVKGVKVPRGVDPNTGEKQWYYVEYRQAIGFDDFLSTKPGITSGVVIHSSPESSSRGSQLLDMTPQSNLFDTDDAALPVGSSFTDPDAGITISTEWVDTTGASIHVSFTEATCTYADPVVSVMSSESSAVAPGSTISYNLTVANNDSYGCDSTAYDVSSIVPEGWSSTATTLELAPGTTNTLTLAVTSSEVAIDGSYDITFNAVNSADSSVSSSAVASYLIEAPAEQCVLANPSVSLSAKQSGEFSAGTTVSYIATVTSNDSSSCDTATVDVVPSVPDGWSSDASTVTLAPGQSVSVNLNVTSAITAEQGVYPVIAYTYNTADLAYNSSAESSYTVAAPELVCTESAPKLSVSSNSGDVTSGSTVTYDVTVTNQNSTDCDAKTYMLSADVPSGWNSSSKSVSLASGQSATVQLDVTSSAVAADGTYSIAIYAQDSEDSGVSSDVIVNYVITNPANSKPVAVNDTVVLSAKEATLIDVLANDRDPDGDTLIVSSVTQGSKGSVEITTNGQLLYTPAKNFKGSDSFSYTISDGDMTATATVSISMDDSSGPGNNKGKGKS